MEAVEDVLRARAAYTRWYATRAHVLAIAGHTFPGTHPLRVTVEGALFGNALGAFRVAADGTACRACDVLGDEAFCRAAGRAPTALFYGAPVPEATRPANAPHSQWLALCELQALGDIVGCAESFMGAARALTTLPRTRAELDRCETHFRDAWRRALVALGGVRVDLRGLFVLEMALRRRVPVEVSSSILRFLVDWPQAVDDGPRRKRRRI